MFKTVSESCNLACDYCYYSRVGGNPRGVKAIDLTLLRQFFAEYMQTVAHGTASFAWQGGEPTLAGLAFFEAVVAYQADSALPGTTISNAIQTNALLLNDHWAQFFRTYAFLVGVSLDGPEALHDTRRIDRHGRGSFARVMRGLAYLQKHEVDFNVLTVVHQQNVKKARELFAFYKQEGLTWVQFIPCMSFQAQDVKAPGRYDISPEEYGQFLCEAFDYWYQDGHPTISVRMFDNLLSVKLGHEPELCVLSAACPPFLVVEQNGDVFPCDFLLDPEWRLGNLATDHIPDLFQSRAYGAFQRLKPRLADTCRQCQWLPQCHGGCPRTRGSNLGGLAAPDYFCDAYKTFFQYADRRLSQLSRRIQSGEPL